MGDKPLTEITLAEAGAVIAQTRADRDAALANGGTAAQAQVTALQQRISTLQQRVAQVGLLPPIKVQLQRPEVMSVLKVVHADASTGTLIITVSE